MKKFYPLIITLGFLIILALGFFIGQLLSQNRQAQAQTDSPPINKQILISSSAIQESHRTFTPAASNIESATTSGQAITTALHEFPDLKAATGMNFALGYLNDPVLQQMAAGGEKVDPKLSDSGLVWVIAFDGLHISSSGPPEAKHSSASRLNVVIDATTGEYIMAFN